VSQGNPEAREVEEGAISGEQILMTDQQASELAKPGVGSFDDPTPLVAPQCSAIRIAPLLAILPVRGDQLDAAHRGGPDACRFKD